MQELMVHIFSVIFQSE